MLLSLIDSLELVDTQSEVSIRLTFLKLVCFFLFKRLFEADILLKVGNQKTIG